MLVLSRHRGEAIMIGDDIVLTVVDIRGDNVRLGIKAPQDVPVHRQEVYEAIQRELRQKTAAAKPTDPTEPPSDDCERRCASPAPAGRRQEPPGNEED